MFLYLTVCILLIIFLTLYTLSPTVYDSDVRLPTWGSIVKPFPHEHRASLLSRSIVYSHSLCSSFNVDKSILAINSPSFSVWSIIFYYYLKVKYCFNDLCLCLKQHNLIDRGIYHPFFYLLIEIMERSLNPFIVLVLC